MLKAALSIWFYIIYYIFFNNEKGKIRINETVRFGDSLIGWVGVLGLVFVKRCIEIT